MSTDDQFCSVCGRESAVDMAELQSEMFDSFINVEVGRLKRRFIIYTIGVAGVTLLVEGIVWGLFSGVPDGTGILSDIFFITVNIGMLVVTAATAVTMKSRLRFLVGNIPSWIISVVFWLIWVNVGRSIGEAIVT